MPAKSPPNPAIVTDQLAALGARIRMQRKALRVSATALAEVSGMSRVSVHRIARRAFGNDGSLPECAGCAGDGFFGERCG